MADDRRLASLGLAVDSVADPLAYPGGWPATSGVLWNDRYLEMTAVDRRRLGQWRVSVPAGELPPDGGGAAGLLPLRYLLLRLNQAYIDERYPMLAVGANAAPMMLRHKFAQAGIAAVVPMAAATVDNLAPAVAAHISRNGYVPATTVAVPGATSMPALVLWLTRSQLDVLDATEGEPYARVLLPPDRHPIQLASGEVLGGCHAYVNRYGYLTGVDGSVDAFPAGAGQRHLIDWLLTELPELRGVLGDTPEEFVRRAAADDDLREKAKAILRAWARVCPADLDGLSPRAEPCTYGAMQPANPFIDVPGEVRARAARTPAKLDRRGQPTIVADSRLARRLGKPQHVAARAAVDPGGTTRGIVAVARLVVAPANQGVSVDPCAGPVVPVDQTVRDAVGIEVGEELELAPVRVRRRWIGDLAFGRPSYVAARVQAADRSTMERELGLLDELSLETVGVQSGDEVVVEGAPRPDGQVREVRIKMFRLIDAVREQRLDLHGGDFTCRAPSSRDALGIFPDLPWVFLDDTTRAALGVDGQRLAVVRVRCSRGYQVRKELREMSLVLGIAFIGLVSILPTSGSRALSVVVLVVLVLGLGTWRMRSRLSQSARHRDRVG